MAEWTFPFGLEPPVGSEGNPKQLGNKGARLFEMCTLGLPVPPGVVITVDAFKRYREDPSIFEHVINEVIAWYGDVVKVLGYEPLLSVRSGAPVSMPGMMDTFLNVGLCDDTFPELCDLIGNVQAADCRDRLEGQWLELLHCKPQNNVLDQLRNAVRAVWKSWDTPRAKAYREQHEIADDVGTAVVVQVMVYGNAGADSGSGVMFTRDPNDGTNGLRVEFMPGVQGEDVVGGLVIPETGRWLNENMPEVYEKLAEYAVVLEDRYGDMQDVEFTVWDGDLFILQTRAGKRTARAAFKIALDMMDEEDCSPPEVMHLVTVRQWDALHRVTVNEDLTPIHDVTGIPASSGVAVGRPVSTLEEVIDANEPVIYVTEQTLPEDFPALLKAAGVVTATGGFTSHAAVVARSLNKPCVVGCGDVLAAAVLGNKTVSVCGDTGRVWGCKVSTVPAGVTPEAEEFILRAANYYNVMVVGDRAERYTRRVTAASWYLMPDLVPARVQEFLASYTAKFDVVLDLTPPSKLGDFAEPLDRLTNPEPMGYEYAVTDQICKEIAKQAVDVKGSISVILPQTQYHDINKMLLEDCGLVVVHVPNTFADLMKGGTVELTNEFIHKVAGNDEAADILLDVFNAKRLNTALSVDELLSTSSYVL